MVTFKYDPLGRRIQKSSATSVTIHVYDGAGIVAEYDAAGMLVAKYAQGTGIDEPVAMWRGGTVSYYQADGLGSITSVTDSVGSAVAAYTTDSFGKSLGAAGSVFNAFRYTAREWDQETGLYYYRARYYDPTAGRFLNEDPIGFNGGSNFYRYSNKSPNTLSDPLGLAPGSGSAIGQQISDLWSWFSGKGSNISHTNDPVTNQLANTPVMNDIRDQYKKRRCNYAGFICGDYQYRQLFTTRNLIGQTVGSFCCKNHSGRKRNG